MINLRNIHVVKICITHNRTYVELPVITYEHACTCQHVKYGTWVVVFKHKFIWFSVYTKNIVTWVLAYYRNSLFYSLPSTFTYGVIFRQSEDIIHWHMTSFWLFFICYKLYYKDFSYFFANVKEHFLVALLNQNA